jgi:hypothetical protein
MDQSRAVGDAPGDVNSFVRASFLEDHAVGPCVAELMTAVVLLRLKIREAGWRVTLT